MDIYQKLIHFSDKSLIEIVESISGRFDNEEVQVASKILKERGFDIITEAEFKVKKAEESKKSSESSTNLNFKPLIIGIVLIGLNFFISGVIYEYNVTGQTDFPVIIDYLRDMGITHDILVRGLVLLLVFHYINKQDNGKHMWLWVILGLAFGGWLLIVIGVKELLTTYPVSNSNHTDEV